MPTTRDWRRHLGVYGLQDQTVVQCHYCTWDGAAAHATVDHIIPRALGGRDVFVNYTWACSSCNAAKGASYPECRCEDCESAVVYFAAYLQDLLDAGDVSVGYTLTLARGLFRHYQVPPPAASTFLIFFDDMAACP